MKKHIKAIIAVLLLAAISITPVFAEKDNANYGNAPKSTDAITLDGVKDAVYDYGLMLPITRDGSYYYSLTDNDGTKGTAWILWQDGFMYVYVEVTKDKTPILPYTDGLDEWMYDSVEVMLDPDNDGSVTEQYRVDAYGNLTGNADFEGAYRVIDSNSYAVEHKIPITKGAGADIGFLIQINMMWADDDRSLVYPDSSTGEAKAWDQMNYDYIVLSADEVTAVIPEAPVEEPPATEEPTPTPTAAASEPAPAPAVPPVPQTGDMGLILSMAGMIVWVSLAYVIKAKKVKNK